MTERENALEVIHRTGKAQWIPIVGEAIKFFSSSGDFDRPQKENGTDWFGCYWVYDEETNGCAQPPHIPVPVSDITRWKEQVKFPDLDIIDWAECARRDLADFDRENQLMFIKTESGTFERLHQLLGFEDAFIAMYDEPEAFCEFMEAIMEFRIRFYDKLAEYYRPDIILVMDDLGSSNGPLLSPEMYRQFIKPYDKKIIQSIHAHGIKVAYHSCGCMQAFIPDILEMGADLIDPLQGGINDHKYIQETFGDQVVFIGCQDGLIHLPGTPEAVLRAEVRRIVAQFWPKKNLIASVRSFAPGANEILLDELHKANAAIRGF